MFIEHNEIRYVEMAMMAVTCGTSVTEEKKCRLTLDKYRNGCLDWYLGRYCALYLPEDLEITINLSCL